MKHHLIEENEPNPKKFKGNGKHLIIGVLALQGAFLEHLDVLNKLGVTARSIRLPQDLEGCDGLIIPGGESTTMGILAEKNGLLDPLRKFVRTTPTWVKNMS